MTTKSETCHLLPHNIFTIPHPWICEGCENARGNIRKFKHDLCMTVVVEYFAYNMCRIRMPSILTFFQILRICILQIKCVKYVKYFKYVEYIEYVKFLEYVKI